MELVSILFKPLGILSGVLAGMLARKLIEKVWLAVDDQQPPDAEHRGVDLKKMVIALLLEGAIFSLVRGLVDHGARVAFARYTGVWPGEERPELDEG